VAVVVTTVVGLGAIATGKTDEVITLSAIGAVLMYLMSMASLFKLRRSQPQLVRPFLAPAYPFLPGLALVLSAFCLVAMLANTKPVLIAIFVVLMVACAAYFARFGLQRLREDEI